MGTVTIRLLDDDGGSLVLRTARKPHTCADCGAAIAVGEKHIECYWSTPAYVSGYRYCWRCAERQCGSDRVRSIAFDSHGCDR